MDGDKAEQRNWRCVPSREWKREEARESTADFAREKAQDYTLEEFAAQGCAWISHVVLRMFSEWGRS